MTRPLTILISINAFGQDSFKKRQMRHFTLCIFGLLLATTSCGQVDNKVTNTPQTVTATFQTIPATADSNAVTKTFSSKTDDYFIKVVLQFSDTTLTGFTLTGNCNKCNFSFGGQPKQIGNTQNVSLPSGDHSVSTQYGYFNENYTFVFELWNGNNSRIKLKAIQINNDQKCKDCPHDIIMGQLVTPVGRVK